MWRLLRISPEMLQAYWPMAAEGLEQVRRRGRHPWTLDDLQAAVREGRADLYAGFIGEEYAGCMVLARATDTLTGGGRRDYLLVWAAYARTAEAFEFGLREIRAIARRIGAGQIRFNSPRPGWIRRARRAGFIIKDVTYEVKS